MNYEKIYLIINPKANRGRSKKLTEAIFEALKKRGFDIYLFETERAGHATEFCRSRKEENSLFLSLGGDGTINEVINGLAHSVNCTVAVLPLGSGNDFAKALGMTNSPQKLIDIIDGNILKQIDLVEITSIDSKGILKRSFFINSVGIGLDAQVAYNYSRHKILKGFPGYISAALYQVFMFKPFHRIMYVNDTKHEGNCLLCAVGNGISSGGGFYLTPDADFSDGLLDICWVGDLGKLKILQIFPTVMLGKHGRFKEVNFCRTPSVRIECMSPVPIHVDGEILGLNEVTIEIKQTGRSISFLMPK